MIWLKSLGKDRPFDDLQKAIDCASEKDVVCTDQSVILLDRQIVVGKPGITFMYEIGEGNKHG